MVAVVGCWAIELFGLASPTIVHVRDTLILRSPVDLADLPVIPALAISSAVMIALYAILARGLARRQRSTRDHLHVQTWQLRQLIARD